MCFPSGQASFFTIQKPRQSKETGKQQCYRLVIPNGALCSVEEHTSECSDGGARAPCRGTEQKVFPPLLSSARTYCVCENLALAKGVDRQQGQLGLEKNLVPGRRFCHSYSISPLGFEFSNLSFSRRPAAPPQTGLFTLCPPVLCARVAIFTPRGEETGCWSQWECR